MMQRVCEKCCAVIKRPTGKNIFKAKTYYTEVSFFRTSDTWIESQIDLCDKCSDRFLEWLEENPVKEDGNV